VTIDTTAPAALSVSLGIDGRSFVYEVIGLESGAMWEYKIGDNGSWTVGSGTRYPASFSGSSVRQTDVAGNVSGVTCPLILDLNGDGVKTVSVDQGVLFDVDNDGTSSRTGWAQADDGLLVRDLDHNGIIDDGGELFGQGTLLADGSHAADGFAALGQFDVNGDGRIDARDLIFGELQVWRDGNGDGVSQADEMLTLEDLGIVSFNLEATEGSVIENGNLHGLVSSYTLADGSVRELHDVWFEQGEQFIMSTGDAGAMTLQPASPNAPVELTGADMIDLSGASANRLTLSPNELPEMSDSDRLMSEGEEGDSVEPAATDSGDWHAASVLADQDITWQVWTNSMDSAAALLIDQNLHVLIDATAAQQGFTLMPIAA